jgi:hypothetical protein
VTDVVYLLSLISLPTGHATIGNRHPWGTPTVTVTNRTPLLAGPSGLSAPAKHDGRKGRAGVFWRPDGR